LIDLGPEGGVGGGQIIAQGTPEEVAQLGRGHTAKFLEPYVSTRRKKIMELPRKASPQPERRK
jgi:excinuclease ABC subunit A